MYNTLCMSINDQRLFQLSYVDIYIILIVLVSDSGHDAIVQVHTVSDLVTHECTVAV